MYSAVDAAIGTRTPNVLRACLRVIRADRQGPN